MSGRAMIIRVQSSNGTKRIECSGTDSASSLMIKIRDAFNFPNLSSFIVYKERNERGPIIALERKTVNDFGLKHGDMVYVSIIKAGSNDVDMVTDAVSYDNNNGVTSSQELYEDRRKNGFSMKEDEVDTLLWKESGLIERPPDARLCQHELNAKCIHCIPIEPFNETYLKDHNIKHMSFHSYLRKMTRGIDKGKFAALEDISCKIKAGCTGHAPWPNGICSKCQPNAVTLNRQTYRHVDNVVFENPTIVENFLNYWRTTGHQRIGFLYGHYEVHKDVPLGVKAKVLAIYEPPQDSTRDSVVLNIPDKNEAVVTNIANKLGLKRVGWIFTDLLPEDIQKGTVKRTREADTYFLSSQECIMAGHYQNCHPNPCRLSPNGFFGSKFVTVCVTGDKENQVHMEGYQVSNQCMALVRDNCFVPTKDAPELGYVKVTTKELYVPDVFYKEIDSFSNEVTKMARPLPIEYLLVDVPVSTPIVPVFFFNPLHSKKSFPVENRLLDGHVQDVNRLFSYLKQFDKNQFLEAVSDFHLLVYLATMDIFPLCESMEPLLMAVKTHSRKSALEWSTCDSWATVEQVIAAHSDMPSNPKASSSGVNSTNASSSAPAEAWNCAYCTYENPVTRIQCEICGLPKQGSE